MDFIIDEAEISDGYLSENSDCSQDGCLLDDFIKSENDKGNLKKRHLICPRTFSFLGKCPVVFLFSINFDKKKLSMKKI